MTLRLVSDRGPAGEGAGEPRADAYGRHLHALGGTLPGSGAGIGSDTAISGMAALYAAALSRDRSFASGDADEEAPLRGRMSGARQGPYVSQFLLIGSATPECPGLDPREAGAGVRSGHVALGTQRLAQRGAGYLSRLDHGTDWAGWQDARDGHPGPEPRFEAHPRFVATPRDLASRVRLDPPHLAPLTAALLLQDAALPPAAGLPDARDPNAAFGAANLLSLVTEAAGCAARAVRHDPQPETPLRPQALAAGIALALSGDRDGALGDGAEAFARMAAALDMGGLLDRVAAHNAFQNALWSGRGALGPLREETNALLPMVSAAGAPGALPAVAAGACVTVLKACFELFDTPGAAPTGMLRALTGPGGPSPSAWEACPEDSRDLRPVTAPPLSVLGELDKLAANLALGCVFAGDLTPDAAHAALRRGERIGMRLLCEEAAAADAPVTLRLISFDGDGLTLAAGPGAEDTPVTIWTDSGPGDPDALRAWWSRQA